MVKAQDIKAQGINPKDIILVKVIKTATLPTVKKTILQEAGRAAFRSVGRAHWKDFTKTSASYVTKRLQKDGAKKAGKNLTKLMAKQGTVIASLAGKRGVTKMVVGTALKSASHPLGMVFDTLQGALEASDRVGIARPISA